MNNLVKRIIADFLILLVGFVLQSTIFYRLAIGGVSPDVLLICVCTIGFMRGRKEGLAFGTAAGIIMDIFTGSILGMYTLVYIYLGYFSGLFSKRYFSDDIKLPMGIIAGADILYNSVIYFVTRFLRGDFNYGFYFTNIIIPNLIYTFIVALFIYLILLAVNKWLNKRETRNAQRFV